MNIEVLIIALFIVSVLSTLTVQGLKKILDGKDYSANLLAIGTSIALSLFLAIVYVVLFNATVDAKLVVEVIVLMYLSFLVATNGYDKVVQTLRQIEEILPKDKTEEQK